MALNNAVNVGLSGSTGTGSFVGSGTPTITTPKISSILDTNSNTMLSFVAVASSVNYMQIYNAIAGGSPLLFPAGSDANIGLQLFAKGAGIIDSISTSNTGIRFQTGTSNQHITSLAFANTLATQTATFPDATGTLLMTGQAISTVPSIAFSSTSGIIGTTTNDSAAAGSVGQLISSVIPSASSVSITSTVAKDVTSISLTAGDWDVWGNVGFTGAATTIVNFGIGWISTTTATIPDPSLYSTTGYNAATTSTTLPGGVFSIDVPKIRISIASTTTVYLSVRSTFTTSTCTALGAIYARRIR